MVALAVTEAVKSIRQAEELFELARSNDPRFFSEWQGELPALTTGEEATCDRIKASYLYNSSDGPLTESTINLLLVSPLMYLSGFCDPPFQIRGESSVEIKAKEGDTLLRGRIDALVLQKQIWLVLVESKQAKFSFSTAIPQALTYTMSGVQSSQTEALPRFSMVTNGDVFLFLKVAQSGAQPSYALSDDFSLFKQSTNQLYTVLRILKQLRNNTR